MRINIENLITRKEASRILGIPMRTLDRMRERGIFTQEHPTGARTVFLREDEVRDYIKQFSGQPLSE